MGKRQGKPYKGGIQGSQKAQGMQVKVYLVLLRSNTTNNSQPHERIIAVKLTRAAAEAIVEMNPGSYVHKVLATK
jgi:hypothetical protein